MVYQSPNYGGVNPKKLAEQKKEATGYRKEFNALPEVKTYKAASTQYDTIQRLANQPNPSAATDMSLIFAYMKMLDPESVVREGEYANAEKARGVPETVLNIYNKTINGNRLSPKQRQEFAQNAEQNYKSYRSAYNQTANEYQGYLRDAGLSGESIGVKPDRSDPRFKEFAKAFYRKFPSGRNAQGLTFEEFYANYGNYTAPQRQGLASTQQKPQPAKPQTAPVNSGNGWQLVNVTGGK